MPDNAASKLVGVFAGQNGMGPGERNLAQQGFVLQIESLLAKAPYNRVEFSAFVDMFSDAYNAEWNGEQVFGRMDPISTFTSTRRAISVSWKVPAFSEDQARQNMNKINQLISFLYPSYWSRSDNASTINMGPLVRIKFGNLIQSSVTGGGLLGYVNGHTMDPIIEDGVFMDSTGSERYLPKTIRLNFEFTVLHEHPLGWDSNGYARTGTEGFPYTQTQGMRPVPVPNAGKPGGGASTVATPKAAQAAATKVNPKTGQKQPRKPPTRTKNPGSNPAAVAGPKKGAAAVVAPKGRPQQAAAKKKVAPKAAPTRVATRTAPVSQAGGAGMIMIE